MKHAWMVGVGEYSDYQILTVALTREEAQQYADAYNAARENYQSEAEVEEIDVYRNGDPLPSKVSWWNADNTHEWELSYVQSRIGAEPKVERMGARMLAQNYPTREAARAAVDEAMRESDR